MGGRYTMIVMAEPASFYDRPGCGQQVAPRVPTSLKAAGILRATAALLYLNTYVGVSISIPFDVCLLAFVREVNPTRLPIRPKGSGKSTCFSVRTSYGSVNFVVIQGLLTACNKHGKDEQDMKWTS
jgi:hypothetical protein